MKTITKTETKVLGYESFDGEKFLTKAFGSWEEAAKECEKYEASACGMIVSKLLAIPHIETDEEKGYMPNGNDEVPLYLFSPQTEKDLDIINMFLSLKNDSRRVTSLEPIFLGLACGETLRSSEVYTLLTMTEHRKSFDEQMNQFLIDLAEEVAVYAE